MQLVSPVSLSMSLSFFWCCLVGLLHLHITPISGQTVQPGFIQAGELQWSQVYSGTVTPTPWSGRFGFSTALTSQNTLLLTGGLIAINSTYSIVMNDVQMSSTGGSTWLPTQHAPFAPRFLHSTTLTSTGSILMIGGFSLSAAPQALQGLMDTWYTTDGVSWTVGSQMPWPRGRGAHAAVADSNSLVMYVIGGMYIPRQTLNDVWITPDGGLTWQLATGAAPFTSRAFHSSIVRQSVVYVLGGATYINNAYTGLLDAWSSIDQGTTWTQLSSPLPFTSARFLMPALCYNDLNIYMLGGVAVNPSFTSQKPSTALVFTNSTDPSMSDSSVYSDVWSSSDAGLTWVQVTPAGVFGPRFGAAIIMIGQDLTVIGGLNQNAMPLNDVYNTILPLVSTSNDGTVLAAIIGTLSGIFIFFIIVLRRMQDDFADGKVIVSGHTETELLKSQET